MARTKSPTAKTTDTQLFVDMFPQCVDAVQLLHKHGFGPEHAYPIMNHSQNGKPIAAKSIEQKFNSLSPEDQKAVARASFDITDVWPQFLRDKTQYGKESAIAHPEWMPSNAAADLKSGHNSLQGVSSSDTNRLPTAGQVATAAAGLAAAGGAVTSWRDRAQQRNAPQQNAQKNQGGLSKTLAFAAGAVVLLGAAVYAYSRSQNHGLSR